MDRRQRKTREAIFTAFTELLATKNANQITVGEIIEKADIGRATFYAHFETKDYLLKELSAELFCHVFDPMTDHKEHKHIFRDEHTDNCDCETADSVFLHLFRHIKNNDNNVILLLSGENNGMFLSYFKKELSNIIESQLENLQVGLSSELPRGFVVNYIASTLIETIKWWIDNKMQHSPEEITKYYLLLIRLGSI